MKGATIFYSLIFPRFEYFILDVIINIRETLSSSVYIFHFWYTVLFLLSYIAFTNFLYLLSPGQSISALTLQNKFPMYYKANLLCFLSV